MFRSVPPHIYYPFRALVLIAIFSIHRTIAQHPRCRPELGTDINPEDCNMAASMLIKDGPGRVSDAEWARDRRFTISQHIAGVEDVGFGLRLASHGTCELQVRVGEDSGPVQTSWHTIFGNLARLLNTCVKACGIGGAYVINGFYFVVEHSGCVDASESVILEDTPKYGPGPHPPAGRRPPPVGLQPVPGTVRPFAPGTFRDKPNELTSPPSAKEEHPHPPARGSSTTGALRIMPGKPPLPPLSKNRRPHTPSSRSPAPGDLCSMADELPSSPSAKRQRLILPSTDSPAPVDPRLEAIGNALSRSGQKQRLVLPSTGSAVPVVPRRNEAIKNVNLPPAEGSSPSPSSPGLPAPPTARQASARLSEQLSLIGAAAWHVAAGGDIPSYFHSGFHLPPAPATDRQNPQAATLHHGPVPPPPPLEPSPRAAATHHGSVPPPPPLEPSPRAAAPQPDLDPPPPPPSP